MHRKPPGRNAHHGMHPDEMPIPAVSFAAQMDRMKEEGSAGAAQGRQRNRPATMPERMKKGVYSIGGQIEVKGSEKPREANGATHLTHESLRRI